MKRVSTTATALPSTNMGAVGKAWEASFDRFCLAAGIDALGAMMEKDAEEACGARHARSEGRRGHRWGRARAAARLLPCRHEIQACLGFGKVWTKLPSGRCPLRTSITVPFGIERSQTANFSWSDGIRRSREFVDCAIGVLRTLLFRV